MREILILEGVLPKSDMSVYPMFENSVGREVDLADSCRPAGLRVPFALSPSTHVLGSAPGVPRNGTPESRSDNMCGAQGVHPGLGQATTP